MNELEKIFHETLNKSTDAERQSYLDRVCADDQRLRERVSDLLSAHRDAGNFLDEPLLADSIGIDPEHEGDQIGPYKIRRLIGEGGMGVVYLADQEHPIRRRVALKIIKLGMDTKQVIARFEAERQALALMDHPNIARVLDAGATETGRPYFVMELVKGVPIGEYCDKHGLDTRGRLGLFLEVCRALHHAHQRGVIHRDIKPSNVLVAMQDGRPVPKIIDFGIAKATIQRLTDKTVFTEFRQFIGTPQYMSPEQADPSGLDIDTRADVYSLGVLLYELLSGRTPFDEKRLRTSSYEELIRILRTEEPPVPSLANPELRGDLDWIALKCLEKDRTRRFDSASDLADDIARHLRNEPVNAGPPSLVYKLGKFVRRHRLGVLTSILVTIALLVGLGFAAAGFLRANEEARRSQAIADFLQDMLVSTDPMDAMSMDVDVASVVETAREVFGDDHAALAATLGSLATQLQGRGNYTAAEPLHRESIARWRSLHGDDSIHVAFAIGRLGTLLRIRGDSVEAESALRECLRLLGQLPDKGGVVAASSLFELSEVLQNRGAYDEAAEAMRESLRIRRAAAPHQSFWIALSLTALARMHSLIGKNDELLALIPECVEAWRDALPPASNGFAKIACEFGVAYVQFRELDLAEPLLREAVEIHRSGNQLSSLYRDMAIGALAQVIALRDDGTPEYIEVQGEFLDYVRETTSPDAIVLGKGLSEWADVLSDRKRPVQALVAALESVTILAGKDEATHWLEAARRSTARALKTITCSVALRRARTEEPSGS